MPGSVRFGLPRGSLLTLPHPGPAQVVARCGRITDQWGEPVPEWIDTAEVVLQAGLEQVRV